MKMRESAGAIWIISDGNPGEYNQSLAVAEALTKRGYGPIFWVKARRLRVFLRRPTNWLLDRTQGPLPEIAESAFIRGDQPAQSPRLVISSNIKTAHANVIISRRYNAPNVFIGVPRHMSTRHFSLILHSREDWSPENGMRMNLLPTRLSAAAAREKSEATRAELALGDQRVSTMLIGGNSGTHSFQSGDWKALAEGMNRLAAANGFKWLVTTSRRTGTEAEKIMRAILNPELVADATWWGSQARPVVVPYLSVSDVVFCTQDSRTMLSEGLAAGKPVYALVPDKMDDADGKEGLVAENESLQRLRRVHIAKMGQIDVAGDRSRYFKVITADVMEEMAERIVALLNRQTSSELKTTANRAQAGASGANVN
jgi:mitochondrial fission protein ELM1